MLDFGVIQRIAVPFATDDEMHTSMMKVRRRLETALADLDDRTALRDEVAIAVKRMATTAAKRGIRIGILSVDLRPIDLSDSCVYGTDRGTV